MIRIAVVLTDPVFGKKKQNIGQCLDLMSSVSADLYVLPELFATGYNFVEISEVRELSEPMGVGETYSAIQKFAAGRKCFVVKHPLDLYWTKPDNLSTRKYHSSFTSG